MIGAKRCVGLSIVFHAVVALIAAGATFAFGSPEEETDRVMLVTEFEPNEEFWFYRERLTYAVMAIQPPDHGDVDFPENWLWDHSDQILSVISCGAQPDADPDFPWSETKGVRKLELLSGDSAFDVAIADWHSIPKSAPHHCNCGSNCHACSCTSICKACEGRRYVGCSGASCSCHAKGVEIKTPRQGEVIHATY